MKIGQQRWMWKFYLDISIDLKIMGRLDADLQGLFKALMKGWDGKSSCFDRLHSFLLPRET